jgi:threonine dehydratase/serine racemase
VTDAPTLADVHAAAKRIAPYAHRTPVMTSRRLDERAERRVFVKCENLQRVGAFKFRGACNAVLQLPAGTSAVVTHSSGNHAQALACAAAVRGIKAHIVMPENAPRVKRAAVEGYGAEVVPCVPTLAAREAAARDVVARTGGAFVHPYDDARVVAGQGTAALELLESVPDLDAIVAPIGGGGLMSGTCIAARGTRPAVRLFAAEPKGADDAARSLAAGRLIPQTAPDTIADGLLTSLGAITWPIVRDHLEAVVTVTDEEIVAAIRFTLESMKLLVEPSGAVPIAAILSESFRAIGGVQRVGVIVSGGNVDLARLADLLRPSSGAKG